MDVPGYKLFGRSRKGSSSSSSKWGEGGICFLASELLQDDVIIIKNVKCDDTICLRVRFGSSLDLFIGCVYTPVQCTARQFCSDRFV